MSNCAEGIWSRRAVVVSIGLALMVTMGLTPAGQAMSITEILLDPVTDNDGTTYPRYIEIDLDGRSASFDLVILNQGDYPEFQLLDIAIPENTFHLVVAEGDWPEAAPPPSTTELITVSDLPFAGATGAVRHVLAMDGTFNFSGFDYRAFHSYPLLFPSIDSSLSLLINNHGQNANFSTHIDPYTPGGTAFQDLGPGDAISRQLNNDLTYGDYSFGPVDGNLQFEDGWTLSPGLGATPMSNDDLPSDPPDDPPAGASVPLPPAALAALAPLGLLATRRRRR